MCYKVIPVPIVSYDLLFFYPSAYRMMQCAGEIESRLPRHTYFYCHRLNKLTNSPMSPKATPQKKLSYHSELVEL